jgi:hypothetical protein
MKTAIFLALVHHPVLDRTGREVTTALTNVDVHDLARSARTFGLSGVYIVTPVALQQRMVHEVVEHWTQGDGSSHLRRAEAIARVKPAASVDQVRADIAQRTGRAPVVVVTAARYAPEGGAEPQSYAHWREVLRQAEQTGEHPQQGPEAQLPEPVLLVFGTGWGLAPSVLAAADVRLAPVYRDPLLMAPDEAPYNHLSVRAAVAIILDRLLGDRDP